MSMKSRLLLAVGFVCAASTQVKTEGLRGSPHHVGQNQFWGANVLADVRARNSPGPLEAPTQPVDGRLPLARPEGAITSLHHACAAPPTAISATHQNQQPGRSHHDHHHHSVAAPGTRAGESALEV